VVVITGATSGLGLAAAETLAALGARIVIVGRDPARTATATARVGHDADDALCDLGLLADVRRLAARLVERYPRIDALVHNAGALLATEQTTSEGREVTVATHLIGPYLLTGLLAQQLDAANPGRVVFVSSGGALTATLDVATLLHPSSYTGVKVYAHAKRAQITLARELARRLAARRIRINAMHPGWCATPGINAALPRFSGVLAPLLRSPGEGVDTIAWLVASDAALTLNGQFVHDRHPRRAHRLAGTARGDDALAAARLIGMLSDETNWSP
jgi:dehydrogenase/reductase SDR family member 12